MSRQSKYITVGGIPVMRMPDEFITPDWDDVVDAYPEWCRKAKEQHKPLYAPQPFLTEIAQQLAELSDRGRTAEQWCRRLVEHFGTRGVALMIEQMKETYEELSK